MATDIKTITLEEASNLIKRFGEEISNPTTSGNIADVFKFESDGTRSLFGYTISTNDFVELLSHVGVMNWKFSFGYDDSAEEGSSKFKVILQGTTESGLLRTPSYLLETPIYEDPLVNQTKSNPINSTIVQNVPHYLVYSWTRAWSALVTSTTLDPAYCMLNLHFGATEVTTPVLGYSFEHEDLVGCLDATALSEESVIRVYLVNHSKKVEEQHTEPGTLGLLLAGYASDTEVGNNNLTAFFDFSKPCPPTC